MLVCLFVFSDFSARKVAYTENESVTVHGAFLPFDP